MATGATLGGIGTLGGNVVVSGTLHPGSSPGILKVSSGAVSFSSGIFAVDLNGNTAGNTATSYGQLVLTSGASINLTGATLVDSTGAGSLRPSSKPTRKLLFLFSATDIADGPILLCDF